MTITVYKSTDASAPVLSGVVGSLIALLDACLVNGYGSQSAAGWGKPFSGTNLAVYRAASGLRHYLNVDDTAAQQARVSGFETMTAVNTGTAQFPTTAQFSGGMYWNKSITANSTARPWTLIADAVTFYFWFEPNGSTWGTTDTNQSNGTFGEFTSYKASDGYSTLITGNSSATLGATSTLGYLTTGSPNPGHYIPRTYLQSGVSIAAGKSSFMRRGVTQASSLGNNSQYDPWPDLVSGGINFAQVDVVESTTLTRGRLRGLFEVMHYQANVTLFVNYGDTIAGTGPYAGLTFMLMKTWTQGAQGWAAMQISGAWT